MKTVHVNTQKPYDVFIGEGILSETGSLCAKRISPCKTAIISDDTVAGIYLDKIKTSLIQAGFDTSEFIFSHGEASKNIAVLSEILEFLAENKLTRTDTVIALGGGVPGDIAGFAAAVYLRGIRYVQIPTTLLSQVDSSVGGKTAVNLSAGKNLAGAFNQPKLVICDTLALDTLDNAVFSQGMAEVIKYGIVFDEQLFKKLQTGGYTMPSVVEKCVSLKRDVVQRDEFDRGERQLLNFGHTIGHALERLSEYRISHGDAVAAGMVMCARASFKLGFCAGDYSRIISDTLGKHGLPSSFIYPAEEIFSACLVDKKINGDTLTLIIPEKLGRCVPREIPVSKLAEFIRAGVA